MLGTLAKKLRMFGFDCMYNSSIDDESIISLAKIESRVIITMDSNLAINAMKRDILVIKPESHTEKEQLIEIAKKMNFKKFELQYSHCSLCNGKLNIILEDQILEKIPPMIRRHTRNFWQCDECMHIFWEGSHIKNMKKLVGEINARL